MRLVNDPSDPDTLAERNRRGYARWAFLRAYGGQLPDPLTVAERAVADYELSRKRVEIRLWMRQRRYVRFGNNVVAFTRGAKP